MGYVQTSSNDFADYQMGEGFGSAVTGRASEQLSIKSAAQMAQNNSVQLPAGLQGYEQNSFGEESNTEIAALAKDNALGNTDDDAFAGYVDAGLGSSDDEEDEDDEAAFDGYGGLAGTPEESFHTFFHKASMANTDSELIRLLAKAVKAVPDDTPESIRKEYYDLAMEMLRRRKNTNLRHLDLQRAEIESNIGWLVNPKLPKTGGFNAMLKKAIGSVGAKLGQGEKEQIKIERQMDLGKKLRKSVGLAGFEGLSPTVTYIGLALVGLAISGAAYYMIQKRKTATVAAKKKKRK